MILERERIVLSYTSWVAARVAEAEREAGREIQAAVTLGEVSDSSAPFFATDEENDAWYEACFGITERELVEQADAAARRFHRTPRRRFRQRREALAAYIRTNARVTVAAGCCTEWR